MKTAPQPWTFANLLPFACIAATVACGMNVDVIEVDAAQYAHISRYLACGGSLIEFFDLGRPYLDKPPLIFWMSAISFKIFGANNFAYRLPSVLFAALAVYSVFAFTRRRFGSYTANIAALLFSSCQAFFLMNQDVKTDMYLIAGFCLTLWQFDAWMNSGSARNAAGTGLGLAIGLLAKGPLGVILPAMVFLPELILQNTLRKLFRPSLWISLIPVALLLSPMLIGLYSQFGREGLEFFFWKQSFGRITGESKWKNDADAFFLLHTFAWAFLPWTIFFLAAVWQSLRTGFQLGMQGWKQSGVLPGFLLAFAAFSLSKFKLPHYIFVVLPLASIHTGAWLAEKENELKRAWFFIQGFLLLLCLSIPFLLALISFPGTSYGLWILYLGLSFAFVFSIGATQQRVMKLVMVSVMAMVSANLLLNGHFYPRLLQYQSHSAVIHVVKRLNIPVARFRTLLEGGHSTAFYHPDNQFPNLNDLGQVMDFVREGQGYIYTNEMGERQIREMGIQSEIIAELPDYRITRLTLPFLDPRRREGTLKRTFLLKVSLALPGDESVQVASDRIPL